MSWILSLISSKLIIETQGAAYSYVKPVFLIFFLSKPSTSLSTVWCSSSYSEHVFAWWVCSSPWRHFPAKIYFFKVNNRSTRKRHEICSKLTIKTQQRHQLTMKIADWRRSGVFILNWRCSGVLLLTLNIFHTFF